MSSRIPLNAGKLVALRCIKKGEALSIATHEEDEEEEEE
jgi:hypothetical protein